MNALPKLHEGHRLSPQIECLKKEQMLEVISWFVDEDSLSLAQDFLKAIS